MTSSGASASAAKAAIAAAYSQPSSWFHFAYVARTSRPAVANVIVLASPLRQRLFDRLGGRPLRVLTARAAVEQLREHAGQTSFSNNEAATIIRWRSASPANRRGRANAAAARSGRTACGRARAANRPAR